MSTKFKFKIVAPKSNYRETTTGQWIEHEGADWGDACNDWHYQNNSIVGTSLHIATEKQRVNFVLFENESGEKLISRVFSTGIMRKGAVRLERDEWLRCARELGVDVRDLQENEWAGEESEWTNSEGKKVAM